MLSGLLKSYLIFFLTFYQWVLSIKTLSIKFKIKSYLTFCSRYHYWLLASKTPLSTTCVLSLLKASEFLFWDATLLQRLLMITYNFNKVYIQILPRLVGLSSNVIYGTRLLVTYKYNKAFIYIIFWSNSTNWKVYQSETRYFSEQIKNSLTTISVHSEYLSNQGISDSVVHKNGYVRKLH